MIRYTRYFLDRGVKVYLNETRDGLKIRGLSSLPGKIKSEVLEFARQKKEWIIIQLKTQNLPVNDRAKMLWKYANNIADWVDNSDGEHYTKRQEKVPGLTILSQYIDKMILQCDQSDPWWMD